MANNKVEIRNKAVYEYTFTGKNLRMVLNALNIAEKEVRSYGALLKDNNFRDVYTDLFNMSVIKRDGIIGTLNLLGIGVARNEDGEYDLYANIFEKE